MRLRIRCDPHVLSTQNALADLGSIFINTALGLSATRSADYMVNQVNQLHPALLTRIREARVQYVAVCVCECNACSAPMLSMLSCVTQGPALYAYNDAVFSTDDWKGIRLLQESIKEEDPLKVGRFGLGFKSVFHMTGESSRLKFACF